MFQHIKDLVELDDSEPKAITGPYSSQWQAAMDAKMASWKSTGTSACLQGALTTSYDTSLLPFYVLVYVDDLVFATTDTEALALVKSELQKRHTCTDLGELRSYLGLQITWDRARRTITLTQSHMVHQVLQRFGFQFSSPQPTPLSTSHSLSAPPLDESVEPSGPYPELVGCLMYPMTCTRPDLAYPLSLLARYVAPVSWRSTRLSSVLSSSCEAEIYTGAMAALELRWLTYLLIGLGEKPRSPPVLYVDNKAMIALCQEHRTKHIAMRYFLARELQQRGQLRLAYVATRANTADIFTKALPPGSSLYTLATKPPQVVASTQVSASGQVAASCSCRLLLHQTLLWHHRLGHPYLPRLRGMHSRLLVSCLPRSLPPLLPSPALPCLPCVDGRQRATPHSSSFPWTTAPLQTLHMDVWGPARDLSVLRLHSNRGGEFSSDLLRDFCRGEGILQSFTLPASPQQNGIAERRIGLVMEVAPQPLAPCLLTGDLAHTALDGEVGDASVFRVWGSRAFVRDTSADKLSARAIPCVFLGFVPDAPGWQFYHPTSRRVLPSQDVTFDESVPFYRLFPYRSTPPPLPPLFLAPSPPPVDPLLPKGPAPSGVSQVDPLRGTAPVEVPVSIGAAPGAASGGAASGGAEPGGAGSEVAGSGGAEPGGEEPGGAEPEGVEPGGAKSEGAESGGAEPRGAASSGGPAGASPRLSLQQLREWLVRRARLWSGAPGAGGAGDTRSGGAEVTAGAGGPGGTAAAGPGGARARGTRAAGSGGVGGAGAGDPTEPGAARAGGSCAGGAGAGSAGAGGAGFGGTGAGGAGATGAGAVDPGAGGAGGTVRPRPYFVPLLQQPPLQPASPLPSPSPYTEQSGGLTERHEPASRPVLPVRSARRAPRLRPPPVPVTHAMVFRPSSVPLRVPLPAPPESSLPEVPDPESERACAASPTVSRLLATAVTDPSFESATASALIAELLDFANACRLDYATTLEDFECLAAAVPRFASMLLAPEGDPDAPDIPTPRSYAEAITGPYSSQWQTSMDTEMASWKSTCTYVDEVPPPRANIVDGMWIFRVKRPPGSPSAFKAHYVAWGFSQRQGVDYFQTFSPTPKMTTLWLLLHVAAQHDYELHSLDFSTAFLQGSLHEEIWLRRPPGFMESFPEGTQWSLRRPVYGLGQEPREWHDTLRTMSNLYML
ncbi:unnamed protein product [Closterium sp. NIES-53]